MMKVLAVSHSCVVDVNQQLYVALDRLHDVQVELVTPANWQNEYTGEAQTPRLLPGVAFPVHCLPVAKPGHNSLHFYRAGLTRTLQKARPDVVFIDEEPWSLALAQIATICRRLRVPYVAYTKQNLLKQYPPPFSWLEQRAFRASNAIVALSEEVRGVLRRKGFTGKCPLLAHACDLSLFTPRPMDSLRAEYGLRGMVFGYMGRLVPEKGLDTLLQAAHLLRKQEVPPFSLFFVGAGPQDDILRATARDLELESAVHFAGSVPHLRAGEYMNCMDALVLPSRTTPRWKEQFGRVIIEAMACDVPVIGSDSGEIPHLIRATGGGLVFGEGNEDELAQHMHALLADVPRRIRMGQAGGQSVRRAYTYDAIALELACILRQTIE